MMCGFIVQVECENGSSRVDPSVLFQRIEKDLRIRGPDAQNYLAKDNVFMAHSRLSIIALTTGHQPMVDPISDRTVVFNGEIYNHLQLRDKFLKHRFSTDSDTEILLALENIESPQAFLNDLRGMFSFSVVDFKKKRLLVARDRFGKKPLFVGKVSGKFFASSRLNTIIEAVGKNAVKISPYGLGYFADFGFIPAPFSMIENIEKLLPGEWRVYDLSGNMRNKGFVKGRLLPGDVDFTRGEKLEKVDFEKLMQTSLQRRLVSERPVGLLLSDGIDSSIVAKTLVDLRKSHLGEDVKAIILASGDQFDESKGATEFAKRLGLGYEIVPMKTDDHSFEEALSIIDEPFADLSLFPTFQAFRALSTSATVALTGDGGDELFGGYPFQYQNRYIGDLINFPQSYGPLRRLKLIKDMPHSLSRFGYLYRRLSTSGLFYSKYYQKYKDLIPSSKERFESLVARRDDFKIQGDISLSQWHNSASLVLSDRMLTKVDICSMGAGVEARSPFLDEDFWNKIMLSDATKNDLLNSQCKTFLKAYLKPFKDVGTKRGFSMDYTRYSQRKSRGLLEKMSSKFLSDSTAAGIADHILSKWFERFENS